MQTILVVDDDPSMRNLLVDYLSKHNFHAFALEDGSQLRRSLAAKVADLVIVDLNLGEEDGLEIVRELNEKPDLPVIIISGDRLEENDKVVGLETGASDYITKPFGMHEFLARVRAALRGRIDRAPVHSNTIYVFDEWRVNTRHRKLRDASGEELKLTSTEYNLLMAFLKSPRQTLSREQLLIASRVYDQEIFDRSIDVLILRLRRKLELDASNPRYIKTERGMGYHFDVDVHIEQPRQGITSRMIPSYKGSQHAPHS
ncbi:response regulator [Agrobacterium fabrum]|uniref:response regulator n=1 Tax=Agrobacterium fabrum TaxID=1176649 RepID=UPI0024732B1C|nr:response regulator [Agrobacterium fabrum]MDH6298776.1 two-component system OmpR family response regulator [Agrobacterium fabrum]